MPALNMPMSYEQGKQFFGKSLDQTSAGGSSRTPTKEPRELNRAIQLKPKQAEHDKDDACGGRPFASKSFPELQAQANNVIILRRGIGQAGIGRLGGGKVFTQQVVEKSLDRQEASSLWTGSGTFGFC